MRRSKHKKDTRANTHWDKWVRAKGEKWGPFKHSDRVIEGKKRKAKVIKKDLEKEINA